MVHGWKTISQRFSVSALPTCQIYGFPLTQDERTAPDSALFPRAFNLRHFICISGASVPILSYIAFPNLTTHPHKIPRQLHPSVRPTATLGRLLVIFQSSPLLDDLRLRFRELTTEP